MAYFFDDEDEHTSRMTCVLRPEDRCRLDRLAREHRCSRAAVVRRALKHLDFHYRGRKGAAR